MLCSVARQYRYFIFISSRFRSNIIKPRKNGPDDRVVVLETLKKPEIRVLWAPFPPKIRVHWVCHNNKSGENGERSFFRVCYQNYFNHKFRSRIGILCKLPRGFCLWKFSFNTLIACRLPLRSSSRIKLKFLEYFFFVLLRLFSFTKTSAINFMQKGANRSKHNFHAYTLITWWKTICFSFRRTRATL